MSAPAVIADCSNDGGPGPEVGATCGSLEPPPGSPSGRLGARAADRAHHPAVIALAVFVAAYAVLTVVMLVAGTAINHLWVPSSLGHWDESVSRWFAAHRTPGIDHLTAAATLMANTLQVVVIAAAAGIVLMLFRRWREALLLAVALGLEITVFLSVTYLVGRPRPNVPRLDSTPDTASFPSGHIAASLVLWGAIALCVASCSRSRVIRVVAWCVAVIVPLSIGFARVYRGMHHVTDVVAGGLMGIACLAAAVFAVRATSAAAERRRRPAAAGPVGTAAVSR